MDSFWALIIVSGCHLLWVWLCVGGSLFHQDFCGEEGCGREKMSRLGDFLG